MNYEAAIKYAHQRMREVGKDRCDYHFEPVFISGTREERERGLIVFPAYNEVYILINHSEHRGICIFSDNIIYNSEDPYNSGVPEFTGYIKIFKLSSWSLEGRGKDDRPILIPFEFLRVVIY